MTSANADTPEAFAERERRKRVIDLARAIFVRTSHDAPLDCIHFAEQFDAVAEKYRKDGKL